MSEAVENLLAAINEKIFDLLRLLEGLTILQTISLTLQADLAAIIALGTESNIKLEAVKVKLDAQIVSLAAIIEALSVLHNDNLAQGVQLDTINTSVTNFHTSFEGVQQTTDGRQVLKVQSTEPDAFERIIEGLGRIEQQLSYLTDVELNGITEQV